MKNTPFTKLKAFVEMLDKLHTGEQMAIIQNLPSDYYDSLHSFAKLVMEETKHGSL